MQTARHRMSSLEPQDASAERFKALSEAYSVIGDREKRTAYDAGQSSAAAAAQRGVRHRPRPTYSTSPDGSHGVRTSSGAKAWNFDVRASQMGNEAAAAAAKRATIFAAASGQLGGIGRTYHHPGQAAAGAGAAATEDARTAEYDRRHRVLGMRLRGGFFDPNATSNAIIGTGSDKTASAAFAALGVLALAVLASSRARARETPPLSRDPRRYESSTSAAAASG
jgi:curved DNA-binding protein CbpA